MLKHRILMQPCFGANVALKVLNIELKIAWLPESKALLHVSVETVLTARDASRLCVRLSKCHQTFKFVNICSVAARAWLDDRWDTGRVQQIEPANCAGRSFNATAHSSDEIHLKPSRCSIIRG